ncbi:MAG: replicative DNA helicase [Bacteroidota bacterium]|nr:replicative DNA helicase [Bacteroidota bacterium]
MSKISRENLGLSKKVDLGKLPPQALDLEQSVLGALMIERQALTDVIDILKPNNFYKDSHKEIYQAIIDLFNNSEPVDLLTVTNQLKKNGKLDFVGGSYYVSQLTTRVNSASNIEFHSRIILEQSIKRQLIEVSGEVQKEAYEDTTDVFDLLDNTEQSLFDISESHVRKNYDQVKNLMKEAIDELESKKTKKDGITGVPSGFIDLDNITSGWQPSDLIIIAGRPSMGKTALVLSMIRNAAIDHDMPMALFSLEMSSLQIVNRLISAEAELDSDKIKKGNLKDYEWQQLLHKTDRLNNAKIFIDDSPALSILELRAKSRRLKSQHGIKCIIVDYLQLMSGEYGKTSGNREQEIASISRSLKAVAKELNIPVIALSQLSRAVETRGGDKRPVLSDLRESGSIEQDADMVLFVYRADRYDITEDEDGNLTAGIAELLLRKNRNGPTGKVKLKFIERYAKFADFSTLDNREVSKFKSKANNNQKTSDDPF